MSEPEWHRYDKSSKWLIDYHGDSILRVAGVQGIVSWKSVHADVVQPEQLPDGVVEALLVGDDEPTTFVLEIATYPESRLNDQAVRDMTVLFLSRRVVPEVVSLILQPRGNLRVTGQHTLQSPKGFTNWNIRWRVVELWTVPAEQLLAVADVGVIPWVSLAASTEVPELLLGKCRERIDQEVPREEQAQMLAVCRVLASLRYNNDVLSRYFGGKGTMLNMMDFPAIQELVRERTGEANQRAIVRVLTTRFGPLPPSLVAAIKAVADEQKLDSLISLAAECSSLQAFQEKMAL